MMRAIAELATTNMDASRAFWTAAGFTVTVYDSGFAFVGLDEVEFHLYRVEASTGPSGGVYLLVEDVDATHSRWRAAGLEPSPVVDEPWGMREFSIVDPGGNRVRVGTNL